MVSDPISSYDDCLVGLYLAFLQRELKGLYLAIATLAAQFIMEDFFARAAWFTGGVDGASAKPFQLFNFYFDSDKDTSM